jgi:ketol-acid reductoisomerase
MFKPGNKLSTGRAKGAVNKRTIEFRATLEREGFDPAMAMLEIYKEAKKTYDNYAVIYDQLIANKIKAGDPFPVEDKADKYLKIAADMVKDISSYCYPKLKSVEQTKQNPLDDMTAEQKLETMREAVKMMEREVGDSSKRIGPGSDKDNGES